MICLENYNRYDDSSKLFVSAHGLITAQHLEINLGHRRILTVPRYGEPAIQGVSRKFLDLSSEEYGQVICLPEARSIFLAKEQSRLGQIFQLVIHVGKMQDWSLNFMFDWTEDTEPYKYTVHPAGIVDFSNRGVLSCHNYKNYNEQEYNDIKQYKETRIDNLDVESFRAKLYEYAKIWLPLVNKEGNKIQSNVDLLDFLYNRAVKKVENGEQMTFEEVFTCNLSELISNNIIKDYSLVNLTACRGVDKLSYGIGNYHIDTKTWTRDEYDKAIATQQMKESPQRFFNLSLDDHCKQRYCGGSIGILPHGNSPDNICKQQGCLKCGNEGTCVSCREGEAILVNCNKDVTICLTAEEIADLVKIHKPDEFTNLPTIFPSCDVPALTLAALYTINEDKSIRDKAIYHVKHHFEKCKDDVNQIYEAYVSYMEDVVYAFKYTLNKILKVSFDNTLAKIATFFNKAPGPIVKKINTLKTILDSGETEGVKYDKLDRLLSDIYIEEFEPSEEAEAKPNVILNCEGEDIQVPISIVTDVVKKQIEDNPFFVIEEIRINDHCYMPALTFAALYATWEPVNHHVKTSIDYIQHGFNLAIVNKDSDRLFRTYKQYVSEVVRSLRLLPDTLRISFAKTILPIIQTNTVESDHNGQKIFSYAPSLDQNGQIIIEKLKQLQMIISHLTPQPQFTKNIENFLQHDITQKKEFYSF